MLGLVAGLVGCGGGSQTAPLSLRERLVQPSDLAGFRPEGRVQSVTDASRFASLIRETLIRATPAQARRVLTSAGYAAAANREFKQGAEGAALDSTVVQLASKNRAEDVLDWRHGDSLQPCRTRCAFEIRDLRVDGIPGAKGVRRTATAASLRATGDKGRPFELIEVTFVDGPFVYDILTRGPPGSVSADKAIGVAKREYERVKGAPART